MNKFLSLRQFLLLFPALALTVLVACERNEPTLIPMIGNIVVTSDPAGASIILDGEDTGLVTPDTVSGIWQGTYNIKAILANHSTSPESVYVDVARLETVDVNFSFTPDPGSIQVTSTPVDSATIFLNGADTGQVTDATLTGLASDDYVVRVQRAGFTVSPESLQVNVQAGTSVAADFVLTALTNGNIEVTSTPAGAEIWLDGSLQTGLTTPHTLTGISVGPHDVQVALAGFNPVPASRQVTVQPDQTVPADFTLNAQKIVLIESFSNTSCIGCPETAETIHELQSTTGYESDKLLAIKYSMNWPQLDDPHYQANPVDNDARRDYYLDYLVGIPLVVGDGTRWGNPPTPPNLVEITTNVDANLLLDPGFAIGVETSIVGTTVNATVTLRTESSLDLSGWTLNVVLAENPVIYETPPGTEGETEFHWVMRDFEIASTSIGSLDPASPSVFNQTLSRTLSMPSDHLYVIAFVQNDSTREVLQAGSNATGSHPAPKTGSANPATPQPPLPSFGGKHP